MEEEGLTQIGHGGGDWLVVEGFVESVRRRTDPPIPLVDALTWSAIGPLSEQSIAEGGKPVAMPDFTRGRWKTNPKFVVRWQW